MHDMGISQSKQITSLGLTGFKKLVVKNTSMPQALQNCEQAESYCNANGIQGGGAFGS